MAAAGIKSYSDYIPVFIYSHGAYPHHGSSCRRHSFGEEKHDIEGWDEKEFGIHATQSDMATLGDSPDSYTTPIPRNMAIIDATLDGCSMMTNTVGDMDIPKLITYKGNDWWLSRSKESIQDGIVEVEGELADFDEEDEEDEFLEYRLSSEYEDFIVGLYENTRLYDGAAGDEYYNLKIVFEDEMKKAGKWRIEIGDSNPGSPISVRNYLYDWKKQYESPNCIFLSDVLLKLLNETRSVGSPLYGRKVMLYLFSCRNPLYRPSFKKSVLGREPSKELYSIIASRLDDVYKKGIANIQRYHPYSDIAREGTSRMNPKDKKSYKRQQKAVKRGKRYSEQYIKERTRILPSERIHKYHHEEEEEDSGKICSGDMCTIMGGKRRTRNKKRGYKKKGKRTRKQVSKKQAIKKGKKQNRKKSRKNRK